MLPQTRPVPVTIALVALDEGRPVAELGRRLADALGRWGRPTCSMAAEAGHSADEPVAAFAPLLDRAEAANDQVVLVGGSGDEPIRGPTSACSRPTGSSPSVAAASPPRRRSRPSSGGCDLVAWNVGRGSGALSAWAEALEPIETHAVREETIDADIERMARRLAGRSLGIVLSGGGARAFSHIGVLEELEASGFVIDRVAGVSMGAFIGGMFAMGMSGDEIDARCYEEWIRRRPLGDYTCPRYSLIRGDRAQGDAEADLRRRRDRGAPRSFFCGSAELRSGELVVHSLGPALGRGRHQLRDPGHRPGAGRGRGSWSTAPWSTTCRWRRWPRSARGRSSPST